MKRVAFVAVTLLCLLLASCGGGGGGDSAPVAAQPPAAQTPVTAPPTAPALAASGYPGEPSSCTLAGQKLWVDAYMADQYFWNANRATPNAAAATIDDYFQSQLFVPTDRYSFAQEIAFYNQVVIDGTRTGYGYSLAFSDSTQTKLQVRLVEPLGPAAAAGLQRGDTVLAIDGFSVTNIVNGSLTSVTTSGITRTFTLENATGGARSISMVSRLYSLSPVLTDKVLTAATGAKVGYLAYQEFATNSLPALGAAFNRFRAAGVSELIVDLRYNGGGSVTVARALASLMGGTDLSGKIFASIRFNAQNKASDFDYPFVSTTAALPVLPLEGLTQVFFITSPNTASASELVVNSLYPFKKVVTIGGATFGKPFGFQPRSACNTVYNAVNFETFNAAGAGRYTSGLAATCSVPDDLSKALGDPAEKRIAAALGYIQTKACPAVADTAGDLLASSQISQSGKNGINSVIAKETHSRTATITIAKPKNLEPAFGEVSRPRMIAD